MPFLSRVSGYLRFTTGLKRFLSQHITVEQARAYHRAGMQARETAFLDKIERAIYDYPRSPYRKLLRATGVELGDIREMVAREGIEGTLHTLRDAGIYVTFDEFKGRAPVIRGSETFRFRDTDFDNPLIRPHYESSSGGSRGRPTRARIDLDHIAQSSPHWALWFDMHGCIDRPLIFWAPNYPGIVNRLMMCALFGKGVDRWYTTSPPGVDPLVERLITSAVHVPVRRAAGLPRTEYVPLHEAWRIGEYVVELARQGRPPSVQTSPSAAVRICNAMRERGESLDDVIFLLGAEPLTPTRKRTIEAAGARAIPSFGFAEGGSVGSQCTDPIAADDVHITLDAYAITQRPQVLEDGTEIGALLFTALRPACPKVMLNTEIGDYGVIEEHHCGCPFDELGYKYHLHTIRSFQKLTGEGVTVVGSDLYRLVEEVLPEKFGGSLSDYQLIEEQDGTGITRYTLYASPDLGPLDEQALMQTFLGELGKIRPHYAFMADLWSQGDLLRVKRERPVPTGRDKVLPFRTLGPR